MKHFERALQLDPDEPFILGWLAGNALEAGDYEVAIEHQKHALLRDPMNSVRRQNLGAIYIAAGKYDQALDTYRELFEINPDAGLDREVEIPRLLVLLGRPSEAAAAAMRMPAGKYRDQALSLLHGVPEHDAAANAALVRLEVSAGEPAESLQDAIMDSLRLAEAYAFRGHTDEAFRVLQTKREALARSQESETHLWYLAHEARMAPFLKPLHADPRWATSSASRLIVSARPASTAPKRRVSRSPVDSPS